MPDRPANGPKAPPAKPPSPVPVPEKIGMTSLAPVIPPPPMPQSPLLKDNPFLMTQAPKLLEGLLVKGLTQENHVIALYMAGGVPLRKAVKRARRILNGNVLDPVTMRTTRDARLLAIAAGVDPATAFGDARAKLREEIGPAPGRGGPKMTPD